MTHHASLVRDLVFHLIWYDILLYHTKIYCTQSYCISGLQIKIVANYTSNLCVSHTVPALFCKYATLLLYSTLAVIFQKININYQKLQYNNSIIYCTIGYCSRVDDLLLLLLMIQSIIQCFNNILWPTIVHTQYSTVNMTSWKRVFLHCTVHFNVKIIIQYLGFIK